VQLPPEYRTANHSGSLDLGPYRAELGRIAPRLEVIAGNGPDLPFDGATHVLLRHLREEADAATSSYGAIVPMLLTFAAADGSLRIDPSDSAGGVPARFGALCGASPAERRELRDALRLLNPIRDAIAHGERPRQDHLHRFLGTAPPPEAADAPWLPDIFDKSGDVARWRALDLLRRLYRAWLLTTIRLAGGDGGNVATDLTKAQVVDLLRRAAHAGDAVAQQEITSRIHSTAHGPSAS
jgi:hypothetical protein